MSSNIIKKFIKGKNIVVLKYANNEYSVSTQNECIAVYGQRDLNLAEILFTAEIQRVYDNISK